VQSVGVRELALCLRPGSASVSSIVVRKMLYFVTIVDHASKHRPLSLRIGEYQMRKKFEGFIDINLDL
jgi:hypothetical protein